jgi:hypothetical protein
MKTMKTTMSSIDVVAERFPGVLHLEYAGQRDGVPFPYRAQPKSWWLIEVSAALQRLGMSTEKSKQQAELICQTQE